MCITIWTYEQEAEQEHKNGNKVYEVHTPTNELFIKLDNILKFILKSL